MNIMVFGASGCTGQQVLVQALALGHRVTAVVRRPAEFKLSNDRLAVLAGDALDPTTYAPSMVGHDVVIAVLGVAGFRRSVRPMTFHADTARSITTAMEEHGVKRFVGVTSVDVLNDPTTPIWYRALVKPLLRHKYADMKDMEESVRDPASTGRL